MEAVILAAGYGRRMRPLSDACHKALLPVGGTTILARTVEELLAVDINAINVVTGYRAGEVEAYLANVFPEVAFQFIRNDRFADTNNIVSLSLALDRLDGADDIVLIECDVLLAPGILARVVAPGRGNVALLDTYEIGMDGTVVSVADGVVTGVFPTSAQGPGFDYDGKYKTLNVYRFSRDFCGVTLQPLLRGYSTEVDANSYYEAVLGQLSDLAEHQIAAELVAGAPWAEVDDPNDLATARFIFEPDQRIEILDRTMGGSWGLHLVDFAFMRNAYFPTDAMLAALRHSLPELISSYGSTQQVLNEKLSWFLGCDPSRVQALNGAAQAFPILRELLAGQTVAVPRPTFGEYGRMFPGARAYADAPGVDVGTIDQVANEVGVMVVVNPNNPTGTTVPTPEVYELARRHRSTTFLVDESFIAFSTEPSIVTALEASPLDNLIVLCSLSKFLGVPGLRIGYLYTANADFYAAVGERLPIWNLNAPAEYLLELLLKFRPELDASVRRTILDREELGVALTAVPLVAGVHASGGNFLLVRLHGDAGVADRVRRSLLAHWSLHIKDVSSRFEDGLARIRVGVRDPTDNRKLVAALTQLSSTTRETGC